MIDDVEWLELIPFFEQWYLLPVHFEIVIGEHTACIVKVFLGQLCYNKEIQLIVSFSKTPVSVFLFKTWELYFNINFQF